MLWRQLRPMKTELHISSDIDDTLKLQTNDHLQPEINRTRHGKTTYLHRGRIRPLLRPNMPTTISTPPQHHLSTKPRKTRIPEPPAETSTSKSSLGEPHTALLLAPSRPPETHASLRQNGSPPRSRWLLHGSQLPLPSHPVYSRF